MRVIRKILFWTHLSVGLAAGVMVFVMAVTGVLLTYQKQMTVTLGILNSKGGNVTIRCRSKNRHENATCIGCAKSLQYNVESFIDFPKEEK